MRGNRCAVHCRPACGPLRVRGLPAAEKNGTTRGLVATRCGTTHARVLRSAASTRRDAGDLAAVFGDSRAASVGRELTKRFEHVYRGTLGELAQRSVSDEDMTRANW